MKYLLDTNTVIDFFHNDRNVVAHLADVGLHECCVTDITLYELYYGAQCCQHPEQELARIERFRTHMAVVPCSECFREAAIQKSILRAAGQLIEDIDILIATTALCQKLTLISDNEKHMSRIRQLSLQNWKKT